MGFSPKARNSGSEPGTRNVELQVLTTKPSRNPFITLATDGHQLLSKGDPMEIGRFLKHTGNTTAYEPPAGLGASQAQEKSKTKGAQDGTGVTTLADRNASAAPTSARVKAPAPPATGAQTAWTMGCQYDTGLAMLRYPARNSRVSISAKASKHASQHN